MSERAWKDVTDDVVASVAAVPGVRAVVLGGSRARDLHRPTSDTDLGILYADAEPLDVDRIREIADELNDHGDPVVTGLYEWGPWVNGGAWLTIGGHRVDLLYRSIDHVRRVIDDCRAGRYEHHFGQQPPFGFFSPTYLAEIAYCRPLHDPAGVVATLKDEVRVYPQALKRALVQSCLWNAEFALRVADRADDYTAAGCLTRAAFYLAQVLFALNERYFLNDKTVSQEVAAFEQAPKAYAGRVLEALRAEPDLRSASARLRDLVNEMITLAGDLYEPPY